MPERQPSANDLDAPRIVDRHMEVHCCQPHIPPDMRACFLASTGDGALQGQGPRCKDTGPDVAQAARWFPSTSSAQRQEQWLGPSGSGRRSRRRMRTRKSELGTANSSHVGRTVNTRAAWGPACDSSNARDARGKFRKVCLKRALVTSPGCPVLPPSQEAFRFIFPVGGVGVVLQGLPPAGCLKALCAGGDRCRQRMSNWHVLAEA